jgi:hypothetical protein
MSSLPFWYLTADPLWAVVVLTTVDVLGFGPTVRKAWQLPHSESLLFFGLFMARNIIAIAALENHSLTTVLFPAAIAAACFMLMAMVSYRRRVVGTACADLWATELYGGGQWKLPSFWRTESWRWQPVRCFFPDADLPWSLYPPGRCPCWPACGSWDTLTT